FVIDTNVLLHNPRSMFSFAEETVVIPLKVIEELDKFKKDQSEIGKNARIVIRTLDQLRVKGPLTDGVKLKEGGKLIIAAGKSMVIPAEFSKEIADDLIIGTALYYKSMADEVFFVSKDINARIKAQALGIRAIDYEKQKVSYETIYKGYRKIKIDSEQIDKIYKEHNLITNEKYVANEFIELVDLRNEKHTALTRFIKEENLLKLINSKELYAFGIRPKNMEQIFAFNLLLDDSVKLVNLIGKAGTGKTLIAIACGLLKVLKEKKYKRLLVARPVIPMGKDIGYLPGSKEEKLSSWMQPIYDNLDFLTSLQYDEQSQSDFKKQLMEQSLLQVEALTYIRGRSIPEQFMIIDEAQNLTPLEVKTIVSRAGEGTKIVLTGDPQQIDSPYLDENSNGLSYVVEKLKDYSIVGSILLSKTERSKLADIASEQL
ncbi:MAG: PhoH family protein, partial [Spirochaetales bacterium]|nr:PhoH family protein [Spirochaetales bacterium]